VLGKKTQTDKVNTVIGTGTKVEGKIISMSSVRIDGELIGEIKADGNVIIGKNGKIKGDVYASNVTIEGRIVGNISALEGLHLVTTCHIEGDVTAHTIEIERGATFNGKSTMIDKKPQSKNNNNLQDKKEVEAS
jgi:cytoskeletal protein CcmA (bactofilin family)